MGEVIRIPEAPCFGLFIRNRDGEVGGAFLQLGKDVAAAYELDRERLQMAIARAMPDVINAVNSAVKSLGKDGELRPASISSTDDHT